MASQAQIDANRRNSARSSGPSEAGKARSRLNAVKHGMAAQLPEVEIELSPAFEERRERWAAERKPVGEDANWALDRVVAATFRIERCERAFDGAVATSQRRAELAWAEDRALEAAKVAARLSKNPVVAARQLRTSFDGVRLLLDAWFGLGSALEVGDWDEGQESSALDLLGVAQGCRVGRTIIDPSDGSDPIAYRNALVAEEIAGLERLRDEVMAPLDELEQDEAIAGASALHSKPVKLVLRYEQEAWRRYRESSKVLRAKDESAPEPISLPAPIQLPTLKPIAPAVAEAATPPPPKPKPGTDRDRAVEETRRSLMAEAAPFVEMANLLREQGLLPPMADDFDEDDAWLDELEAKYAALPSRPVSFVPIAAGGRQG
jgi:hypothetical protein